MMEGTTKQNKFGGYTRRRRDARQRTDLPLLQELHAVPSLTVMHRVKGDVIYIPPGVMHMVVTIVDKVHLAFHCYEMRGRR